MRLFETTPGKLLLIPIVAATAIGIVELVEAVAPPADSFVSTDRPPTHQPPPPCVDCQADA